MLLEIDDITKTRMRTFALRLSEKDLRAYAAVEAYKLGHGGVAFIAELLAMSPETIKRGQRDLDDCGRVPTASRQRSDGAARKGVFAEQSGLERAFDLLLESHTAGDPMNADIKWTDLQPSEMVGKLKAEGCKISPNTVRALLANANSASDAQ